MEVQSFSCLNLLLCFWLQDLRLLLALLWTLSESECRPKRGQEMSGNGTKLKSSYQVFLCTFWAYSYENWFTTICIFIHFQNCLSSWGLWGGWREGHPGQVARIQSTLDRNQDPSCCEATDHDPVIPKPNLCYFNCLDLTHIT